MTARTTSDGWLPARAATKGLFCALTLVLVALVWATGATAHAAHDDPGIPAQILAATETATQDGDAPACCHSPETCGMAVGPARFPVHPERSAPGAPAIREVLAIHARIPGLDPPPPRAAI